MFLKELLRSRHVNTANIRSMDGTGTEIFPYVLSQRRFKILLRCLRFDKSDREKRKMIVWHRTGKFFKCLWRTAETIKVSVNIVRFMSLVPFLGRCPFRQFMQNKPAKYGIKVFCLVDYRMAYTWQMEIYDGKQPECPYKQQFFSGCIKDLLKLFHIQAETLRSIIRSQV